MLIKIHPINEKAQVEGKLCKQNIESKSRSGGVDLPAIQFST